MKKSGCMKQLMIIILGKYDYRPITRVGEGAKKCNPPSGLFKPTVQNEWGLPPRERSISSKNYPHTASGGRDMGFIYAGSMEDGLYGIWETWEEDMRDKDILELSSFK